MEKALMKKYKEMDEHERKKLKELLKDREKSKDGEEKVGWLYKPNKADSEEYLLGKRIDKAIEREIEKEPANQDVPGATFNEVVSRRAEMDMQVKMREDPLYAIRLKEAEERQKVLNNPVKMKQLLKKMEEDNEKSKKKKKKEKKKHKKRSSKDDSSDDSDDELLRKYLAIVEQKKKKLAKDADRSEQGSKRNKDNSRDRDRSADRELKSEDRRHRKRRSTESSDEETSNTKQRTKDKQRSEERTDERHQRRRHHDSDDEENGSTSPKRFRKYGLNKAREDHSPEVRRRRRSDSIDKREDREKRRRSRSKSRSPVETRRKERVSQPVKRKLTSEEMEQKRAEMMANARNHDDEREANIKRYKQEDEEHQRKMEQAKKDGANFIKPMLLKHTEKSSVEDRIKRNVYSLQRTSAAIEKDFTKR